MKARYNRIPKAERDDYIQRTVQTAEEMLKDHFKQVAYRCFGVTCLAIHEHGGYGKKRLLELWDLIDKIAEEYAVWKTDGVDDYILAKRLRECGADYIAAILDEFAEKEAEENRKRGKAF